MFVERRSISLRRSAGPARRDPKMTRALARVSSLCVGGRGALEDLSADDDMALAAAALTNGSSSRTELVRQRARRFGEKESYACSSRLEGLLGFRRWSWSGDVVGFDASVEEGVMIWFDVYRSEVPAYKRGM